MRLFHKIILAIMAGAFGVSVAACNTIQGAGEDISQGGKAIAGVAQSAKDKINDNTH